MWEGGCNPISHPLSRWFNLIPAGVRNSPPARCFPGPTVALAHQLLKERHPSLKGSSAAGGWEWLWLPGRKAPVPAQTAKKSWEGPSIRSFHCMRVRGPPAAAHIDDRLVGRDSLGGSSTGSSSSASLGSPTDPEN